MSRFSLEGKHPYRYVVCGFDPALQEYFWQLWEEGDDEEPLERSRPGLTGVGAVEELRLVVADTAHARLVYSYMLMDLDPGDYIRGDGTPTGTRPEDKVRVVLGRARAQRLPEPRCPTCGTVGSLLPALGSRDYFSCAFCNMTRDMSQAH